MLLITGAYKTTLNNKLFVEEQELKTTQTNVHKKDIELLNQKYLNMMYKETEHIILNLN